MNPRRVARYFWTEWIRPLALPLLCVAAAKSALADINYVPSGSMHPTLLEGDVVWVNKLAYDARVPFTFTRLAHWADPQRGDIVVCFKPTEGTRLVKRVIGVPGDTIELRGNVVILNGTPLRYQPLPGNVGAVLEPAERDSALFALETLGDKRHVVEILPSRPALRSFPPLTLPAGAYFVMGDNRDDSGDSRFFGFMARDRIIGRVNHVVVSADTNHWLKPRLDRFISRLN